MKSTSISDREWQSLCSLHLLNLSAKRSSSDLPPKRSVNGAFLTGTAQPQRVRKIRTTTMCTSTDSIVRDRTTLAAKRNVIRRAKGRAGTRGARTRVSYDPSFVKRLMCAAILLEQLLQQLCLGAIPKQDQAHLSHHCSHGANLRRGDRGAPSERLAALPPQHRQTKDSFCQPHEQLDNFESAQGQTPSRVLYSVGS